MVRDQSIDEEQIGRRIKVRRVYNARARLAEQHAQSASSVDRFSGRMGNLAAVRRRENEKERGWCILRTNSKRTIPLTQSLNEAGIEAWTPQETRKRRLPRGRKGYRETIEPIVPSFVFARAVYLPDLLRALALPISPHPPFSIFQHAGRAPIVADREISHLQKAEESARVAVLKTKRHDIAIGSTVRPTEGAFAGLDGVVESIKGKLAAVCFNEHFRVHVATWLLIDDDVQAPLSPTGSAAQAA